MRLGKKIRYIILPIVMLVSIVVTSIYYGIYKNQIIENKIHSLNEYLKAAVTKTEYDLAYAQSYLQHKIDSKEASLIFTQNEKGVQLTAPYISQFLKQFVNQGANLNNTLNVVNDFSIYDAKQQLIVHINTQDPFSVPNLKSQTKFLLDEINNKPTKKVSQYYYFIDDTEQKLLNLIQVFSPYHLTSQQFYDANDDLYIVQAQVGVGLIRAAVDELINEHNGFIKSTAIIPSNNIVNELSIELLPFDSLINNYNATIKTELFEIIIELDDEYFSETLNLVLIKLLFLSFVLMGVSYFIVVKLIDNQIIFPVTKLAKSIKEVEASLTIELKPLKTEDEVSALNESYISLIKKINNLANNDPLTGLSNRRSFNNSLSTLFDIINDKKNSDYTALFFIDLDNFKYVNDTYGHEVGDLLLIIFSRRLKVMLKKESDHATYNEKIESIARLGGDEFVVLINGFPSLLEIEKLGEKVCALFHDSFDIGVNKFNIHASVGISYTINKIKDGETLLSQADSAMYLAKKLGKNNYKLFTPEIEDKINNELKIENQLIESLKNDQFVLVFMPAYTAQEKVLTGYEVLLRCPNLANTSVGPDIFIPIAEKTDLILMIDLWVTENAFIKLKELINKTGFKGFFAINVSSKSLRNDDFYVRLKALIKEYDIDVTQIELEITETCLMPDDHQAIASLKQLKSLGVSIAIDDFGTGYTSFNQLVNYPLDTLKIDRSFVQSLGDTAAGKKPTLDIIYELAKIYELEVIIEGIETKSDFEHVQKLPGVTVQGFYFTKPFQWEEVISLN